MPHTLRPLRADERDLAVDTLARSFDDDPLFRWMLPDDRDRAAWVRWFHGVSVDRALSLGTAWTLDEGPAAGAITVMPPGVHGPSLGGWIAALRSPPRRLPTRRLAWTGLRVQHRLDALHPRAPVVYVHVLGVHPGRNAMPGSRRVSPRLRDWQGSHAETRFSQVSGARPSARQRWRGWTWSTVAPGRPQYAHARRSRSRMARLVGRGERGGCGTGRVR